MGKNRLSTLLYLLIIYSNAFSFELNEHVQRDVAAAQNATEEITWSKCISNKPKKYLSLSFRTLELPFNEIITVIKDVDNYERTFNIIKRSGIIETDTQFTELGSCIFQTRAGFFKYWSLLNIDSITTDDSTWFKFFTTQNHDNDLNAQWRREIGRWFAIEDRDFYFVWYVQWIEVNRTRVGFFIHSCPKMYVPKWLVRFAMKIVIPGFLDDLEKRVKINRAMTKK